MLKDEKNQKKIILIGGSAIGWSVSAELIQNKTGYRTINLGHYSAFGLTDYQDFIMDNISDEDILILSPEWLFYFNPNYYDTATLDELKKNNYKYGLLLKRPRYVIRSIFSKIEFPNLFKKDNIKYLAYKYDCYNSNGDVVSHCGLNPTGPVFYMINNEKIRVDEFGKYYKYLNRKNTYLLFPPTQKNVFLKYTKLLGEVESQAYIFGLKYIDSLKDNVYNQSSFFDAEYHLKCSEKEKRTMKIVNFINRKIKY
jgi:hypothetical protein